MRTCTACGEDKQPSQFSRSVSARDGLHTWCRSCKARRSREWYASNAEAIRAKEKARYLADPATKKAGAMRSYYRRMAADAGLVHQPRRRYKLRRYGLTLEDYVQKLAEQHGRCALCGCEPDTTRRHDFAVDHCHATGRIRGLLCRRCNVGLGHFEDSPELLANAIAYLSAHHGVA